MRACLKLYDGHDWKWFRVQPQPYRYGISQKDTGQGKRHAAPDCWKKGISKYFLRFSYTEEVPLTKTPAKEQIICSVDLGLNTDAVCTIMRSDGTVLGRRFIDFPSEKDRMYRVLGRISRFQRGAWLCTGDKAGGLMRSALTQNSEERSQEQITGYAEENHADVIVFEYLETKGKISGKKETEAAPVAKKGYPEKM